MYVNEIGMMRQDVRPRVLGSPVPAHHGQKRWEE